jgi:hypothetical protein
MRRTALSKPSVWRWQERYLEACVERLLRDKTRPSRAPPLDPSKATEVIRWTWRSRRRARRRIGPCRRWPGQAACRRPKCIRSDRRPVWRRTGCGASRCAPIRRSPSRSRTWSASTSRRPSMPWCCRSTRKHPAGLPMKPVRLEGRSQGHHRCRQKRVPSVRFDPLGPPRHPPAYPSKNSLTLL